MDLNNYQDHLIDLKVSSRYVIFYLCQKSYGTIMLVILEDPLFSNSICLVHMMQRSALIISPFCARHSKAVSRASGSSMAS